MEPLDGPLLKEPAPLSGMLEKKGGFSLSGSGWKDLYAEVRSPGYLHFYKDKAAADKNRTNEPSRSNDPNVYILNLKLIVDFKVPEKRSKENLELDLELGDDTIKLKYDLLVQYFMLCYV